jgi:hypothetical protein
VLIVLGDSISSGHHHQLQDGQVKLICDAPDYSYAAEVYRRLAARPGRIWADPGQYHNLAHSGFGTSKVFWPKGTVAGGVLDGGTTACMKETAFDAPIVRAVALLKARADKDVRGNKVVITAGINDTNWTQVLRNARMVASTGLDHSKTELQQDLPGWPHSNPDGHNRIATEIVELLPS